MYGRRQDMAQLARLARLSYYKVYPNTGGTMPRISDASSPADYDAIRRAVLDDTEQSYWLRSNVGALENRDPGEALNDALLLAELAEARARVIAGATNATRINGR